MQIALHLLKTSYIFIAIIFFTTNINGQKNQSQNKSTTKYGLYPIKNDLDSRLAASNNIGVDYIRTSVILDQWDGTDNTGVDYWLNRKKKLLLNINNDDNAHYFPTNLTLYKSQLNSFLDVYGKSLEIAVIENEELNNDPTGNLYHLGSLQSYINELTAAVSICNKRKIPVTNGGLARQVAASLKHYYDINGKKDSAQWLLNQMGGIPADSMVWKRCDSLLNAYKTIALSYVNLHWYEPKQGMTRITGVLQTICNYITTCTGKQVITNESGVRSKDSSFITQLMQQWSLVKPDYCILIDDNHDSNNGGEPLSSEDAELLPTGLAYRDYIGGGKACKQAITLSPAGFVNSCVGGTVTLTAASGFGNYLWNDGQTTQSIAVNATGNFWVKSNHNTCMAYSNVGVAVMMNEAATKSSVTANPSPAVNICSGKSVKLSSNVATSYLWNTGQTSKTIDVNTSGNYTVTTSDKNGCKAVSNVTVVTYQPCSAPKNLKVTGISSNKATLNWATVSCAKGYQLQYRIKGLLPWTTQQISSGTTSSKAIYGLTAAVYQWRILTYCSYSPDTIKSAYVYGPQFTISNTLTNTANAIAASLNDFDIKIFPVPAHNVASVSVTLVRTDLEITLMDIYGKVLWRKEKVTDAVTQLPVANLASGIYMVLIKDKEHSQTLRLVKQ